MNEQWRPTSLQVIRWEVFLLVGPTTPLGKWTGFPYLLCPLTTTCSPYPNIMTSPTCFIWQFLQTVPQVSAGSVPSGAKRQILLYPTSPHTPDFDWTNPNLPSLLLCFCPKACISKLFQNGTLTTCLALYYTTSVWQHVSRLPLVS